MKNRFVKIISALLILSFLMTAISVLSFAEESTGGSTDVDTSYLSVFINRAFDEGWDFNNGFHTYSVGGNKFSIDREEDVLGKYNYFSRYEAASASAGYTRINFGSEAVNHTTRDVTKATIIEFSIKVDDVAQLGNIMYATTSVGGNNFNMLDITKDHELILFNGVGGGSLNIGKVEDEWINLAFIYDWEAVKMEVEVKVGYGRGNGYSESHDLVLNYARNDDVGLKYFYIGVPAETARKAASAADSYGMSFCIDDLKVYQGVTSIVELEPDNYGSGVNTFAEKVVDIQEYAGVKSKAQLLEEALAMKVGVDYALARNERYSLLNTKDQATYNGIYGAPVKQGENVLVSLQFLLDYIGFPSYTHPDNQSFDITTGSSTTYITIGRDSATVDGKRVDLNVAPGYAKNTNGENYLVIALEDVPVLFPGWLAIYDDMGLVIVYEDTTPEDLDDNAPIVTREENLSTMVDIMKKFVFDTVKADELEDAYVANGELIYSDTKKNTDNFSHPYIMADQSTFDTLKAKYDLKEGDAGYDAKLKAYIAAIVAEADGYYAKYAELNGTAYKGIKEEFVPTNKSVSDGYDSNGKMTDLVEAASILPTLAFAYQMTGNKDYAKLAYDWSVAIGEWTHWGPGYFTHCAEVTAYCSIAYDWFYNAYKSLSLDTDVLAEAIYELGLHDGYISSIGKLCEHPRSQGDMSAYNKLGDSTNAVGTSGMMLGALAILDYLDSDNAKENARSESIYLLGNNIQTLIQYGLDIYAPDGSYIESAIHWEYATSAFFRMVMALDSATGRDYGLMDAAGIDRTCYYAIHIEDSDNLIWNYHDSELAMLNTDVFNFVGSYLGDMTLLAVREQQLEAGKTATIYDLLFYPFDGIDAEPELELDYHMEAIDGYVTRSGWEDGALYTGIMGGTNNAAHGQIDSGNFIYRNKGISWIIDLGGDNPAISTYEDLSFRYKFYRVSAEGQNVVLLLDNANVAYGQYSAAGGKITDTYSNEHGSYAIIDNKAVYLNTVSYANRGVLLTNDRKTVVLQDEFSFQKVGSVAWVMHTEAYIQLSDDRKTAYLTQSDADGNSYTLRATLVSLRPDFAFETATEAERDLLGHSTDPLEYDRSGISRLVVKATTISFEFAIVFEMLDPDADKEPAVSYEWTPLNEWEPSAPKDQTEAPTEDPDKRGTPNSTDIKTDTSTAESILKRNTAFTDRLEELYKALANVEYTLKTYPPTSLDAGLASSYADYIDCLDEYEEFMDYVNTLTESVNSLQLSLVGIELPTAEE